MKTINEFTADPKQNHVFTLEDGTVINITFEYRANQTGWFMSFIYEGRSFNNRRIVASPNMMRQFKDIIPFGLGCSTMDGGEPMFQTDFSSNRATFYLLNADDVQTVEDEIINA